jgi:hypothetical protein
MLVWRVSNGVIAVGFAPWALILVHRAHALVAKEGLKEPISRLQDFFINLQWFSGGRLPAAVILIGVVLGVVGRQRRDVAVLCAWIVVPFAIGILATPTFYWRYVIGSLPPLLLLAAFGWTRYAKNWQVPILSMATIAIAGLALLQSHPDHKDDWRDVASFLKERERPTDCVLVVPAFRAAPLNYYRRDSTCQWGAMKLADLPSEMPTSTLFGVFALTSTDLAFHMQDSAAYVDELRRRGWRDLDRTDFRGIQVVTFRG